MGLTLDGLDSIEEVNERLQEIMRVWNDLPDDERMTMLPGPAHQGSRPGASATELMTSMLEEDEEDDDRPVRACGREPHRPVRRRGGGRRRGA